MTLDTTEETLSIDTQSQANNVSQNPAQIQMQHNDVEQHLKCTDDLQVSMKFQIGSVEIPFGDLKHLNSGYTFDLQKRLIDQPVSILANDMLFARGELVCIGDFIGVRITQLAEQSAE